MLYLCVIQTWGSPNPSQAKDAIIKVPVSEDIGQAVVIMVLFRVELQKFLHSDISKAKRIGYVFLIIGGIYLKDRKLNNYKGKVRKKRSLYTDSNRQSL